MGIPEQKIITIKSDYRCKMCGCVITRLVHGDSKFYSDECLDGWKRDNTVYGAPNRPEKVELENQKLNKENKKLKKRIKRIKDRLYSISPPKGTKSKKAKRQGRTETWDGRSNKWKRLRYRVLAKNGACCVCCGRSPSEHGIVVHVDHITPKSVAPELMYDEGNLQIMCEDCNMGKGNRDSIKW